MHVKDVSIVTQTAFKETVGLYDPSTLLTDEGQVAFVQTFDVLADALFSAVLANTEKYGDPEPTRTVQTVTPSQAQARVESAFAGTTAEPFDLEVVDKQGDIPAWLIEQCAAAGVRKVFDNRASRDESKNQPYFREVGGNKKGFWPAKAGGRGR